MPKKTLALIAGLILVTVILFIIALRTGQQQVTQTNKQTSAQPTPTDFAHSVLTLSPNPVSVAPGGQGKVEVMLDPSDNKVTAVQLELMYDPAVISNVKVTPGPLLPNAVVLINKNDPQTGQMTYAFGIQPNQQTVNNPGTVAIITFTARSAAGKQAQLTLLPTTLVTARGVADSVLKMSYGTVINIEAQ